MKTKKIQKKVWPKAEVVNGVKVWAHISTGCGNKNRGCMEKGVCGHFACLAEEREDNTTVFFTPRRKIMPCDNEK